MGNTQGKISHPDTIWSHDYLNNCTIVKWGEGGYYRTDFPEGGYTEEVIDEINAPAFGGDIRMARMVRKSMESCSVAAQNNPRLNWDEHFAECMKLYERREE